ncbi:Gfo/Idh/MocA family oxidoreductase (plasmid) [Paracoccus sp. TK19116]|uniref:Gfo/Idh/MocA family oxidoreductase n=1 Tax=Paracoccus albicereus TaxID=2922394 RepID=A0ABT1MMY0_9RHOB|nr:Gfo/Idh/MocA family oxidoreductase [Paracoccus albicereus]MCQ0969139.1 Gfo/Idh/MocA family oxidoreductase [Paracoccus albicereus]
MAHDDPIRLLVLGTGGMAKNHVIHFKTIPGVEVVAGVDRNPAQLQTFCDTHEIEQRFTTLDEALDWGQFDAVSNVTPDAVHYATTMPLLAAGKHVLCEKPLATNEAHAREMADAAARAGVVNMVHLTYRKVAALQAAAQMVREGAIGEVRHFEASYLQSWLTQPSWGEWRTEEQWLWRLSSAHGSKGVLGDVGIHILDFTTFVAGHNAAEVSCLLKTYDKAPDGRIGDYVLDANDSATMQLVLDNGAIGTIAATRFASGYHNDLLLRVHGTLGGVEVTFRNRVSHLRACLGEDLAPAIWKDIETPTPPEVYDHFIAAIRGQGPMEPDFARGAALQRWLDLAEQSAMDDGRKQRI